MKKQRLSIAFFKNFPGMVKIFLWDFLVFSSVILLYYAQGGAFFGENAPAKRNTTRIVGKNM
jgi:hypothetical protein